MDVIAGLKCAQVKVPMNYKGIEYTVVETAIPDVWKWQFRIGDRVMTGKTETRIELLAIRRAQIQINRALASSWANNATELNHPAAVGDREATHAAILLRYLKTVIGWWTRRAGNVRTIPPQKR
jgi:hypothetical protein